MKNTDRSVHSKLLRGQPLVLVVALVLPLQGVTKGVGNPKKGEGAGQVWEASCRKRNLAPAGQSVPGERSGEALQGELSCEVSGPLAQPRPEQEGRGPQRSPRPTGPPRRLLLHPLRFRLAASGARWGRAALGQASRGLVVPGLTSRGAWSGLQYASRPDPRPETGPRVPGGEGGAGRPGSGRGRALSVGGELGAETGDPPERAQRPARGWTLTKDGLFFLGMPAPSQTYLQSHSRDSYTHIWLRSARWPGETGLLPAPEVTAKKQGAPTAPCHRFRTVHLTPPHTR